nr:hypothetical protein [Salmonella sp.]
MLWKSHLADDWGHTFYKLRRVYREISNYGSICKIRRFTVEDLKEYSISRGISLGSTDTRKVYAAKAENPANWSWIYFPHTDDKLVELVDDLTYEGWLISQSTEQSYEGVAVNILKQSPHAAALRELEKNPESNQRNHEHCYEQVRVWTGCIAICVMCMSILTPLKRWPAGRIRTAIKMVAEECKEGDIPIFL